MFAADNLTSTTGISSEQLPAILIGGPPNAGKSVLTYNLTRALRARKIPHYVFRASPDGEGDWSFEGDLETVRELRLKNKRKWSELFRAIACHDLPHRQLPLIVDLGGMPKEEDRCIFQTCQYAILLFQVHGSEEAVPVWHSHIQSDNLQLIAEIRSLRPGDPASSSDGSGGEAAMTALRPGDLRYSIDFGALVERVAAIFNRYTPEQLEQWHLSQVSPGSVVNLPEHLAALAPENDEDAWRPRMLEPLLAGLSEQAAFSVYGRGPAWLYGALALHAGTRPFQQFDTRIGWVEPPSLKSTGTAERETASLLSLEGPFVSDDTYAIALYPTYHYLDIRLADQLALPEPAPGRGVIVSGKLPLWLFTALAHFYSQRDAPWIALNDARDNKAIVIYSRVASHPLGKRIPMPVIV